jgi:small subunit ribosomal protein S16
MVKLRMTRLGKKKKPFYRIIAIDSRKRRDGDYIERLGHFDPVASGKAERLKIDAEKALSWLLKGALPSPTVKNIFSEEGIMLKYDMTRRIKKERVEREGNNGKKIIKYIAVTDENGNPVRKYTDEQVEEAYRNWLLLQEKKKSRKPVEKKVLSKKAKAKIEAEKKAATDAAEAAKKAADEAKKAAEAPPAEPQA